MFNVPLQDKDVSITIIGIIKNWSKEKFVKESMRKMAGKKGKVILFEDFDELSRRFDDVLAKACCKLVFYIFLPSLLVVIVKVLWLS